LSWTGLVSKNSKKSWPQDKNGFRDDTPESAPPMQIMHLGGATNSLAFPCYFCFPLKTFQNGEAGRNPFGNHSKIKRAAKPISKPRRLIIRREAPTRPCPTERNVWFPPVETRGRGCKQRRPLGLLGGAVIRKTSYSEGLKDSSLIGFNPLMVPFCIDSRSNGTKPPSISMNDGSVSSKWKASANNPPLSFRRCVLLSLAGAPSPLFPKCWVYLSAFCVVLAIIISLSTPPPGEGAIPEISDREMFA
jgi:hypothetical protein